MERPNRRLILKAVGFLASGACLQGSAFAQDADFPAKLVRIVVPYGPGGIGDFTARAISQFLTDLWKARVIVENKPGASGIIGMNDVRNSPADGYSVVMSSNTTLSAAPYLFKSLAYDPMRDFAHVGMVGVYGSVALVPANSPFKTIPDLIQYCQKNPDKVFFGYTNTSSQVPSEILNSVAKIKMQGVPYKESARAAADLIGEQIQFMFMDYVAAKPLIEGGKVVPLAVTQEGRAPLWPDLPAMEEFYPGFEFSGYITVSAPAKTPSAVQEKYNNAIREMAKTPAFRKLLETNGLVPRDYSIADLRSFITSEGKKWEEYVKIARISPQ